MAQIKSGRASSVVNLQRKVQKDTEAKSRKRVASKARRSGAVQAGLHVEPENPLPAQHQQKPGIESQLDPRPLFIAPDYVGSAKLKNKVALITGGDSESVAQWPCCSRAKAPMSPSSTSAKTATRAKPRSVSKRKAAAACCCVATFAIRSSVPEPSSGRSKRSASSTSW